MGNILLIDDDQAFTNILGDYIRQYYPFLAVTVCNDPIMALADIRQGGLDLLIIDLEMPKLDGMKVVAYALDAGIDKNRIVILSGRDVDYLHETFPMGTCLAVLNKFEAKQKAVLEMIFGSLNRKAEVRSRQAQGS
jgi:response regulator of citrate/malate metabolism